VRLEFGNPVPSHQIGGREDNRAGRPVTLGPQAASNDEAASISDAASPVD
jgi:hypothetical protein